MMFRLEKHQEQVLLESFLNMFNSGDGDFEALMILKQASSDPAPFDAVIEDLRKYPHSAQALEERMKIGPIDLPVLSQLHPDTLGFRYHKHLLENNLKPMTIPSCDTDYQYLDFHMAETHDIWHVVTGCSTTVLGELQLESFCVAQLKYSRFWLALLTKNLLKATIYNIGQVSEYMECVQRGWQLGSQSIPLFGVPWHTMWDQPLDDVRRSLKLDIYR